MQRRERICDKCGKVEFVFTRTDTCHTCHWQIKQDAAAENELQKLESLGYNKIEGPTFQQTLHRSWTFTHSVCGTQQTWRFGNILKQLTLRPNSVPCKTCGGKERMAIALAAFSEKYGIKDVENWDRYRVKVRNLTEATYKEHKQSINPLGLKRSTRDYHLDHRKAIVQCFLDGDLPEFAARRENLQMLPAFDNLSKGRSLYIMG